MASEIRVDKINSLSGVGTVTLSPTGVDIAGITTVSTLSVGSSVGIGTTNPSSILHVSGSSTPIILNKSTDASPALFIGDSNRDTEGQHLAEFRGRWNETPVARMIIEAGDDTSNKDNGELTFETAPAGSMIERVRIKSSGDVIVGSGITLSPDGDVFTTGITTSSSVIVGGGVTISESGIEASGIGITCANINGTSIGGRRNLIINGAFQWAQRTQDGSVIVQDENYHTVDRFRPAYGVAPQEIPNQEWHVLVGAGASHDVGPWEEGFRRSFRIQNGNQTAGIGTDKNYEVYTSLEAQDVGESGWNYTSSSSFITLQFWVKSSVAQTYYGRLRTYDGSSYNYPFSYALSADTWTKVIKTIPGNSNLQFDADHNEGLQVNLVAMYGTDFTDSGVSVDTWASYSTAAKTPDQTATWYGTNDATIEFTGVQLEVGSQATSFEHRTKAEELTLCQRYYQYASAGAYGAWGLTGRKSGSGHVEFNRTLPHPMRAACTGTWTNTNGMRMVRVGDATGAVPTAVTLSGATTGAGIGLFQVLNIIADTTSYSTGDVIIQHASGSNNNQKYELDAEL